MPGSEIPALRINSKTRLCAAEVSAFAGIDADLFAFVDEGRDLDDKTGFSFGGLSDAGGGGRFEARLGLDYGEFDEAWGLNADRSTVKVANRDLKVRREIVDSIAEGAGLKHG